MPKQDVVKHIASLRCDLRHVVIEERPCMDCVKGILKQIDQHPFIDVNLIEDTAVAIANLTGNYEVSRLKSTEFDFAYRFLEDIIPSFLDRVREMEVKDKLSEIKAEVNRIHSVKGCGGFCAICAEKEGEKLNGTRMDDKSC